MSNDHEGTRNLEVEEDTPVMQSVQMSFATAPAIPLRSSPLVPKSAGKVPLGVKPVPPIAQNPWKVSEALVMPSYHVLERTHAVIDDCSAEEISRRIADCFRNESIYAVYDDKEAVARAETGQCVKFAVRLWQSGSKRIAVEIQRTFGCCFLYQQTAKAILRAASGTTYKTQPPSLPMPPCVPPLPDEDWDDCTAEGLQIASMALKCSNKVDSHLFAIESLVKLSEATKCREYCAKNVLRSKSEILDTILSLIQCSKMDHLHEIGTEAERKQLCLMHRHAATIFANCLESLDSIGGLTEKLVDIPELSCSSTLEALVRDVSVADSQPHHAAAACRCLKKLCCKSDDVKQRLLELGASTHLVKAQHCRHAQLEHECSELMEYL